ncbi:MAG: chromosomal replication initiator protein DnaA [Desulfocapsaceae bacterium]|jgi:chromosomal replication initiator protein|nr:chromosomal replication initiator protein DnaA [Desulfocapsaceae bacterium]
MMIWEKAKEKLQEKLTESVYELWIEPLTVQGQKESSLVLSCPDRYFGAYVNQNFLKIITEKVNETDCSITHVMITEKRSSQPVNGNKPKQLRLPALPAGGSHVRSLHPRYTFDNFMVGESNILAESACRSISVSDDAIGPCLYINSSTGLGKSHLSHAIAHQVLDTSPMTRLHYLTAQQFAAEMVHNIKSNNMDIFKRKYHDHCDVLLVEDIQSLTGKKKTQQELNELLDALIKLGKRVVLTANSAPRELVGIDNEFTSRMTSGLVTSIREPDLDTRQRIVLGKAAQHKLELADEYVLHIAQHIKGDVRRIESAVVAIRARAALQGGRVDETIIEDVVRSIVGTPKSLSAQLISELVGSQFKISVEDMQSRSRKKKFAFPRQVAMYLSRKHTEETLADIGRVFNRDHSTVMHSIKVISCLNRRDNSISAQIDLLSKKVNRL